MESGTVFHFVTKGIETALEQARAVAQGKGVRIGGYRVQKHVFTEAAMHLVVER